MKKINSFKKASVFSMSMFLAGMSSIMPVAALEILANNYSMSATTEKMTAQELCKSAGLVSTDPTENVTWKCTSANLNTTKAGRYSINIRATDNSTGDVKDKTIQIQVKGVKQNTAPVLTLTSDSVTVNQGDSIDLKKYVASATDNEDGDLSGRLRITGSVNTQKPGTYNVTYRIYDNAGAEAVQTLAVKVIEVVKEDTPGQGGSEDSSNTSNNGNENTGSNTNGGSSVSEGTNGSYASEYEGEQLPSTSDTTTTNLGILSISAIGVGAFLVSKKKKEVTE